MRRIEKMKHEKVNFPKLGHGKDLEVDVKIDIPKAPYTKKKHPYNAFKI